MAAAIRPGPAQTRPGEDAALRNVIERLRQQFPELDSDIVARTVHGRYDDLDEAPVRDFIPVIIERSARKQLKAATAGRRR